jgi:eukaryotic-like serine/threonine-protein kinase
MQFQRRMNGRSLQPREAVDYAMGINSDLAARHDRGVVHRNIKPDILFVTTDGCIKILDFWLAKVVGPDRVNEPTPTVTIDGVQPATVVGAATLHVA